MKSSGGGRRKAVIAGAIVGLAAVGGGAFAAYSWFTGTGPQPAEALPADTIGYVSLDLDPSGKQKIAFYNAAKKFPAAKEWLDDEGIGSGDDVRKFVFEKIQESGECEDVDYGDDISPWLGDRVAAAAIDGGKDEPPAPVFVAQLKDADKGEDGLKSVVEACGGDTDDAGIAVEGEWMIIAETQDLVDQVVEDAGEASLADDEDFQKWTEAAGDPGILTAYASPDAGSLLAELMADELSGLGMGDLEMNGSDEACAFGFPEDDGSTTSDETDCEEFEEFSDDLPDEFSEEFSDDLPGELSDFPNPAEDLADALKEFGGGALTVRFDEGSLEIETASDTKAMGLGSVTASDAGGNVISTLPEDTAAAIGVGFEAGWFDALIDYVASSAGGEIGLDEMIAEAEQELGLSLPEDAETLFGESAAIAFGGDFDPEVFFNSGPTELPVGAKIKGDPDAIQDVLDKIKATAPSPEEAEILSSESEGDHIVIGPNTDYLGELLEDGDLGDSEVYQDVVREDNVASVFFVNFDAVLGMVEELVGGDKDVIENLEPLAGFGITGWEEDGVGHGVFRLTTD